MSSIFYRVAIAALIVFGSGGCGLYYIMSGDANGITTNNRDLSWGVSEDGLIRQSRGIREDSLNEHELGWSEDGNDLVEFEEDLEDVTSISHEIIGHALKQEAESIKDEDLTDEQLTTKYGPELQKVSNVSVPKPKDKKGRTIRQNQFLFKDVPRDERFKDEKIDTFESQSVAKEWKEYLILADANHVLWEIKHQQLQEYLPTVLNNTVGDIRFGWLKKSTTKEELAKKCHDAYSRDLRKYRQTGFNASKSYEAVWNWCTLPKYWGQEKPTNWPR